MADRYALYAVNANVENGMFIPQIRDWSVNMAVSEVIESVNGDIDPNYVAVGTQAPSFSFTTTKVGSVLNTIGINGLAIANANAYLGLVCCFQLMEEGGVRGDAAAGGHLSLTATKGILLPRRLSAAQGGNAELSMDALVTATIANTAPVTINANAVLTGTPGVTELFTLGPVYVNNTQVNDVLAVDIDFGLQETVATSDGMVWPSYAAIAQRRPSITVRTREVEQISTLGLYGAAVTSAEVYLKKRAEGGVLEASASAVHLKIALTKGRAHVTRGTGAVPSEASIMITPVSDETNPILTISNVSALP